MPKGMEGRLEEKKEVLSRNLSINNREKLRRYSSGCDKGKAKKNISES